MTSPQTFAAHNIDAIVAAVAVPVFLLAGTAARGLVLGDGALGA